ncbi:MAG: HNH endonuclease signature motif containing protein [Chloroflexota bacterium]|nr:HNH endonuclease signature motif containing protein [Chloroflexota bacterium]
MSKTYIPAELRRRVIARASKCCEYCRVSQEDHGFTFQINHINSEKHGGGSEFDNLALGCSYCNAYKGSDIASKDVVTGELTYLFNPRKDLWSEHFKLDGATIVPLTAVGRVTVAVLKLNRPEQIVERAGLIELGRYPCAGSV